MTTNEDIIRALGQIEGKVDSVHSILDQHLKDDTQRFNGVEVDHQRLIKRIGTVEKKQHWLAGVGSALIAIPTVIWGYIKLNGGS
jgi:hypothetical protein